jgi:peptidoglycan hydrolase CwlO-like protein
MTTGTTIAVVGSVIAAVSALCSIVAFIINRKKDGYHDGEEGGEIRGDIKYMRNSFDDLRLDIKDINRKMNDQSERLTRVEESTKQAHKRIDELQRKGGPNNAN